MLIDDYLCRYAGQRQITIVGPVADESSPAKPLPLSNLEQPIIWVDGGANHRCGKAGFAVGDGDSALCKLDQYLPVDKDYSDFAYALSRLPEHFDEIILLGFLGARRDHELFNLGEVHHFLESAKSPTQVRFAHSIYAYSKGQWNFEVHGVFSLAVLKSSSVQLVGACKFQINPPTIIPPLSSLGLSNQGSGVITLHTQSPAFIFKSPYNIPLPASQP